MNNYIVIGASPIISSLFDIIAALNGRVARVYQNVPEVLHGRGLTLAQRVSTLGYDVEVHSSLADFRHEEGFEYVLGFITVQKYKLIDDLNKKYNIRFANLVHPDAHIGSNVEIGQGVTIMPGAVVDSNACLEDHVTINKAAVVGHEARVGKYSVIGPTAVLAGGSVIGAKCFIGMNSCILDNISVGEWTVTGAGSVVTRDIEGGVVVVGSPARVLKKNDAVDFDHYLAHRFPGLNEDAIL